MSDKKQSEQQEETSIFTHIEQPKKERKKVGWRLSIGRLTRKYKSSSPDQFKQHGSSITSKLKTISTETEMPPVKVLPPK